MKKYLWHALKEEQVINILKTNKEEGLSEKEAQKRIERYGLNEISEKEKFSQLKIFFKQFNSPLVYILIFAGLVMIFIREWADMAVIFSAILINTVFGYWEERKTLKILEKLKKTINAKAVVIRNGQKKQILQKNIVTGDLVVLNPGDKIPADGRIIFSNSLTVSQAALTGEWLGQAKNDTELSEKINLADRDNMVYSGCLVESGFGKIIVTETGEKTEIGKIASMVGETEKETSPLKRRITDLSKKIGLLIGIISILIIIGGLAHGDELIKIFETAVAVAVGGVPEALPIIITVILAIGMDRLLKKKGLIRKLSSVETLSSTSVVCFDKTKTLTEGKMERAALISEDKKLALRIAVLANDAFVENFYDEIEKWRVRGNATDQALFYAGREEKIFKNQLEKQGWMEIAKLPFDNRVKYQASLRENINNNENEILITGAPETLLEKSVNLESWEDKIKELAEQGLRVVGLAYKKIDRKKNKIDNKDVKDLIFVGLIAFRDPLRKNIKETINTIQTAGMRPIIITGDYRKTAVAVARKAGILAGRHQTIEGVELD